MTSTERSKKIRSYGKAYDTLKKAIRKFPKKMWKYKPAPDRWSIHEILVHLADSEANSFCRCRKFIVEPGSTVMGYNEKQWTETLNYQKQSTEDALELFRWLRGNTYKLIKTLPEATWANTVDHPENGTMTMDDWLDVYEYHVTGHINQMKKNYDEWREPRKKR